MFREDDKNFYNSFYSIKNFLKKKVKQVQDIFLLNNKDKDFIDSYFNEETNNSEKRRVFYSFLYCLVCLTIIFLLKHILYEEYYFKFTKYFSIIKILTAIFLVAVYFITRFAFIHLYLRKFKSLPFSERMVNTIVEGCIPSFILLYITNSKNFFITMDGGYTLFYAIIIIISAFRLDLRLSLLCTLSSALSYLLTVYFMKAIYAKSVLHQDFYLYTNNSHFYFRVILILSTGIITCLVSILLRSKIKNSLVHVLKRKDLEAILGMHVSSDVARELISHRADKGIECELSVLFLDLRNFTGIAEKKSASEIFLFLNELFEDWIRITISKEGVINKFLGDGFMAIFGAPMANPRHAQNAVEAAIEMYEGLLEKNKTREKDPIRIGVGIHTGKAYAGNVGSELRKEYTIIGDVVNIAARLEKMNKPLKSSILISEDTLQACRDLNLTTKNKGKLGVHGRNSKIQVHQIK